MSSERIKIHNIKCKQRFSKIHFFSRSGEELKTIIGSKMVISHQKWSNHQSMVSTLPRLYLGSTRLPEASHVTYVSSPCSTCSMPRRSGALNTLLPSLGMVLDFVSEKLWLLGMKTIDLESLLMTPNHHWPLVSLNDPQPPLTSSHFKTDVLELS